MDYLKRKVDAGADYICTQLFFNNHDFYDFRERCELAGIRVPILAGIMPITSQARTWSGWPSWPWGPGSRRGCCGPSSDAATTPRRSPRSGIHWATEQCRDLLDNQVRGIHFYTLNRSDATRQIYENLGVKDSQALRVDASTRA